MGKREPAGNGRQDGDGKRGQDARGMAGTPVRDGTPDERLLAFLSPLREERRSLGRHETEIGVARAVSLSDSMLARGLILSARMSLERTLSKGGCLASCNETRQAVAGAVTGLCMGLEVSGKKSLMPHAIYWLVLRLLESGVASSEKGMFERFPEDPTGGKPLMLRQMGRDEVLALVEREIILPGLLSFVPEPEGLTFET